VPRAGVAHRRPGGGEVVVQHTQRDVGQQRGQDPALRCAGIAVLEGLRLGEDACLAERLDQRQDPFVDDPSPHPTQQGRVVDRVETRLDVSIDYPRVVTWRCGQLMNLSDRVLRPMPRPKAVRARLEIGLEDRLQDQFQGRLDDPVPDGRDAQPSQFPARLWGHPFPHRQRGEPAGLQIGPQIGQKRLDPAHIFDVVGGHAVHPSGARTPIAPNPRPGHRQERGIDDQVEQVVKPASSILTGPSVQLGLDLQYPDPVLDRTRCVGVHWRPPDLPAPVLRTRCRPWPCGRLSRPRTTTAAPPRQRSLGGRCACPRPVWLTGIADASLTVPTFTTHRLTGWTPSSSPAVSPRLPRSTSSWPPARPTHDLTEVTATVPPSPCEPLTGPNPSGSSRRSTFGGSTTGSCLRTPLRLTRPARTV